MSGECDKCGEHVTECNCKYREKLMNYFEETLGDILERDGDKFIIKAKPGKIKYKLRLSLLPEHSDENND